MQKLSGRGRAHARSVNHRNGRLIRPHNSTLGPHVRTQMNDLLRALEGLMTGPET